VQLCSREVKKKRVGGEVVRKVIGSLAALLRTGVLHAIELRKRQIMSARLDLLRVTL
jgi:hypothetical protein